MMAPCMDFRAVVRLVGLDSVMWRCLMVLIGVRLMEPEEFLVCILVWMVSVVAAVVVVDFALMLNDAH